MADPLALAQAAVAHARAELRTIILGTASPSGEPEASVAAALLDPEAAFVVYLSGLAPHTRHLRENPRASVLLAADEAVTPNPLARRRLTFNCRAEPVAPDAPAHAPLLAELRSKFGATIDTLASLPDFQLIRLIPERGRVVIGFGAAFEVNPRDWSDLTPIGRPAPR